MENKRVNVIIIYVAHVGLENDLYFIDVLWPVMMRKETVIIVNAA